VPIRERVTSSKGTTRVPKPCLPRSWASIIEVLSGSRDEEVPCEAAPAVPDAPAPDALPEAWAREISWAMPTRMRSSWLSVSTPRRASVAASWRPFSATCLVVLGRHVDKLEFLDVLFGDRPALTPVENFYQRGQHAAAGVGGGELEALQRHLVVVGGERALGEDRLARP
jgi:hypothetical protein